MKDAPWIGNDEWNVEPPSEYDKEYELQDQMHDEQAQEPPYVVLLFNQYNRAIEQYDNIVQALRVDPLDPRYTLRNTRYKYKSGRSTVECAASKRINKLEKEKHILETELRQRIRWLVDFMESLPTSYRTKELEDYFGLREARDYLKEVGLRERQKETETET